MDENIQKYLIELIEIVEDLNLQTNDEQWYNRDLALKNLKDRVKDNG